MRVRGSSKWLVFAAVSLAFFFINLATFTSLGVVLYRMVGERHWSMTAAGTSFAVLGIACGLSSPLPTLTMRWWGGRTTLCIGAGLLFAGFLLASLSQSLGLFYLAMLLLGLGYSFAGNVPGVYLIAGWFGRGSARIIGFYMMLGALGAAFGPPIVAAVVASSGGWRGNWQVMTVASGLVGLVCLVLVRDAGVASSMPQAANSAAASPPLDVVWSAREALQTPQFLLVAAAISFGTGWGLAYVAGTVVLIDYFGPTTGSKVLSIVWLLTTAAAAGPLAAGMIADATGSFALIFRIFAALLLVLAAPIFFMRVPSRPLSAAIG